MLDKKESGFTLLELIITVVIIGILVAIALPQYAGMKEKEHDKDASTSLKLIMTAQRIYRMETGNYDIENAEDPLTENINANTTANITNINSILKLSLPSGSQRTWNYRSVADNAANPSTTCVEVSRTTVSRIGAGRTLRLRNTEDAPIAGNCP